MPLGHGVHLLECVLKWPTGHGTHDPMPLGSVPQRHSVALEQKVEPSEVALGHGWHARPLDEKVPTGQSTQRVWVLSTSEPGSHGVHTTAPATDETKPLGHGRHDLPSGE